MTGERLVEAFERCTLPAEAFRHAQHVEVGWHYLRRYPAGTAFERYSSGLIRLATHFGAPGKYDEDITRRFLELIRGRIERAPDQTWSDFREANPDLFEWPSPLLDR